MLVCSRVVFSVCAVRSRSLAAVSRIVSNCPATAIDAPLVAEASAALISCARAWALVKLSSTFDGETPERRLKGLAAALEFADQRLEAVLAMLEGDVERLLLLCEIPSDRAESLSMLGELPRERARVRLGSR